MARPKTPGKTTSSSQPLQTSIDDALSKVHNNRSQQVRELSDKLTAKVAGRLAEVDEKVKQRDNAAREEFEEQLQKSVESVLMLSDIVESWRHAARQTMMTLDNSVSHVRAAMQNSEAKIAERRNLYSTRKREREEALQQSVQEIVNDAQAALAHV